MAECGTESLRNNLCQNQEDKVVEKKCIQQMAGFPELALADHLSLSAPHGLINGCAPPTVTPVHHHSRQSETEYKEILDNAPVLTPTASEMNVNEKVDQQPKSDSSIKISNVDAVPLTSDTAVEDPSLPAGAVKASEAEESGCGSDTEGCSFVSSYLRAAVASSSSMEAASPSSASPPSASPFFASPPSPVPLPENHKGNTNDLSAPQMGPPPSSIPPMKGPYPASTMMMPIMYYHMMPVSCDPTGQPLMNPMFPSQPFCPLSHSMGPTPQVMRPNISCSTPGMNGASGATGGNGASGGRPLTATFDGYGSQRNLDSRNIPVNGACHTAPSSEENTSEGSRSYSINPGKNTRLTRLRDPVLQWIRKKLERYGNNNWEAVADRHGWNYEDICDHLSDCRHNRESPFLKMLESEMFCAYTVQEFLEDMRGIGRKDILMDFDEELQKNKP